MCSDEIDKKRWVADYIRPAIDKGNVEDFSTELEKTLGDDDEVQKSSSDETTDTEDSDAKPNKRKTTIKKKPVASVKRQRRKRGKEAQPGEDLIAAIRGRSNVQREQMFGNLISGLEKRYSASSKRKRTSKKGGDVVEDIPDEEFEKVRARLEENRKKR